MSQSPPQQTVTPAPASSTISNSNAPASSTPTTTSQSIILIPPNAPAGGISMTQPLQTAVSFYKIAPSQTVTFGWNFTSVLQDSESLTVSAVCDNGNTYPVGPTDGVLPGTATQVLWDLYAWQENNPQQPLAQGTYTLTMWDNRGQSALPKPGLMQPFDGLHFALYTPQPYTPLASGKFCLTLPV